MPSSAPLRERRRARCSPRSAHAGWEPATGREDPVAILERQAETRVPELVPIRYGRMAVSPFAFYRGAAAVMAADLATTPVSGLRVQACGDAHLSNFGAFAAPDRRLRLRPQRLRRVAAGPLGVGRQAACRQLRDRRPRKRFQAQAAQAGGADRGAAPTARRCGSSPASATSRSGTPASTSRRRCRWSRTRTRPRWSGVRKGVAKARSQGQPQGAGEADRGRRRRAADPQRTTAAGPGRGAGRRQRRPRPGASC